MLPVGRNAVPRRHGVLERGDAAIYYEVTGEGPPIVFAHGLGGSHMSWWQQVPAFCDRHTCVTFAHRGFRPSRVDGEIDPDAYPGDLLALLDHLDIARATLVAQSMGGWCALEVALTAPDRVAALVMSATSGRIDPRRTGDLGDWPARNAEAGQDFSARGIHPAIGRRGAAEQPALHLLYREMDEAASVADKEALRHRLFAGRTRGPETVDQLRMKTLFVVGEEDAVFPPAAAIALARHRGEDAVVLPETGHSPYFQRASAFNRVLSGFLAR